MTDAQTPPTTRDGRLIALTDDVVEHRYTAQVDGQVVGVAAYQMTRELVVFTHTETDGAVAGQGVASVLVRFALDDVRRQGTHRVLAVCPFVAAYLARHRDEYGDLDYRSPTSTVHD